ncbi:hypothetical protein SAMN05216360_11581 [Methylobacterium phyllostachyos]|uniref:Uncharacterized protein n=1 Tax=Methylobacterium phyllostachyos TaxID=582672 RepID=A0A1H0H4P1_9HYPH|nr:hypothetical protein [Methylobacterium phyllostachyos]SDO13881.1 hypothetical protein SAMN05216360_11581 [Methylobacterium phyllostachyos]
MARRPRPPARIKEPIFGPPAATARAAFIRFGNALHRQAHFADAGLGPAMGQVGNDGRALLEAALARLPKAEHRLVSEFITELTDGTVTFAEAQAIWRETESDTMRSVWTDPDAFLRFLLTVRDRIDPHAWPAGKPRFRSDGTLRKGRP